MFSPYFRRIVSRRVLGQGEASLIDRVGLSSTSLLQALHTCFEQEVLHLENVREVDFETSRDSQLSCSARGAHIADSLGSGLSVPSGPRVFSSSSSCPMAPLMDGIGGSFCSLSIINSGATGLQARKSPGLASLYQALPNQESHAWRLRLRTATSVASETASGSQNGGWRVPEGGFLALNNLQDKSGARQAAKRVGRGIGSGTGKTAGRGHKGQKARSGNKPRLGFEGGQTPLRKTIPRRGFYNRFSLSFQTLNLKKIAIMIKAGRIDPSQVITIKTLHDAGVLGKKIEDGVKLLGHGSKNFSLPINIEVSRVSESAKAAIEAAGGSVTRVHYTRLGLRGLLTPEWFAKKGRLLPRPARPPPGLLEQVDRVGDIPGAGRLPSYVLGGQITSENPSV